jgi:hypothetical protein
MADNGPIAGTCYLSIDGQRKRVVGEVTWRNSGETREMKVGSDGVHGYKRKPMQGQIKVKVRDSGDASTDDLNGIVDSTVVAELANGKTVIGRNMTRVGDPVTSDAEEAEIELTLEGPDVRDQ